MTDRAAQVRRRRLVLCLCALYAVLFNVCYRFVEAPLYDDTGLRYAPPPLPYILLGYVMALLPVMWLPVGFRRASHFAYWWLYVVVIVPSMFVPYHVLAKPAYEVMLLPCWLLALFLLLLLFDQFPSVRVRRIGVSAPTYFRALFAGGAVSVLWIAATQNLPSLDVLGDLHGLRMASRESIRGGSLNAYLVATIQHCVGPLLIACGAASRRPMLWGLGMLTALFSFCVAGEKTLLAMPFLMLSIGYLAHHFQSRFAVAMVGGASALLAAAMVEHVLFETSHVSAYGSRRVLLVPAHLTAYYWDYFSTHGNDMFANGLIGRLLGTASGLTPAQTIGQTYLGTSEANAGANVWASAFAEAGYAGMLVVTLGVGFLLRLIDRLSGHSPAFGAMIVVCMATAWAEGAFQTSFLSRGVVPMVAVLFFVPTAPTWSPASLADEDDAADPSVLRDRFAVA